MVNLSLQLPPDLFTWNGSTIPVDLRYRYTPNQVSQHGMVSVLFNEQFVHSWPLSGPPARTSAILSQVSGWSGDAWCSATSSSLAELLRNQNSFHVGVQSPHRTGSLHLHHPAGNACGHRPRLHAQHLEAAPLHRHA
jgi:hypothetical protein